LRYFLTAINNSIADQIPEGFQTDLSLLNLCDSCTDTFYIAYLQLSHLKRFREFREIAGWLIL
jgi:hypothetical protein